MTTMIGREVWGVTPGCFVHGVVIKQHADPFFYTVRTGSNTEHILFPSDIKLDPKDCLTDVNQQIAYWKAVQRTIENEEDI